MLPLSEKVYMYSEKKHTKNPESIGFSTVCGHRHPLGVLEHIPTDRGDYCDKKGGSHKQMPDCVNQ